MCEWLSCEEWCDVFLLCDGRIFSAHRAVLASVSKFLRKLLLSCPVDESPTLIFMPEFDLETMSSALHYIYNGEVIIEKRQLDTFLDIMNALQVFVDTRHLFDDKDTQVNKYISINHENVMLKQKTSIPIAGDDIVTIKKEIKVKTNMRCSFDNLNVSKTNQDSNNYKSINIWTGYLKSLEDRQRQQFSTDLFIETYSLNRNSNGVTEGVLAIPNERYREPTSVLLENANVDHLSNDLFSKTSYKVDSKNVLSSLYNESQTLNSCNKASERIMCDESEAKKKNIDISINKLYEEKIVNNQQRIKFHSIKDSLISGHSNYISLKSDSKSLDEEFSSSSENGNDLSETKQSITRVTILNKVLQSPWRPQLPNTFTPYPKKNINLSGSHESETIQLEKKQSTNDKNNNNKSNKFENHQNNPTSTMALKKIKRNVSKEVFADDIQVGNMREHSLTRYTCTECQKSFSQLCNYKYHMSVHRGTKEFATTCPVCGKIFNDKGYLSSHMKIHRNRKEYKCSLCPKSFNQRVAYNMHVRIHTGIKPHVCEECGKAFSRKMLLKQHQRTHSGERPYACPHCDKRFADRSNMTLHLRLHTGVKPFTCSLCPKSFTKKHHLKSHLNFHTGDKPYACPRCKLAFTQSSNMRTHFKKCNL